MKMLEIRKSKKKEGTQESGNYTQKKANQSTEIPVKILKPT